MGIRTQGTHTHLVPASLSDDCSKYKCKLESTTPGTCESGGKGTMKDPVSGSTYNRIYQHIKKFAKNGDNYCKELISVLQQRADLEKRYAKGLLRLASKITKASTSIVKKSGTEASGWTDGILGSSIFEGWNCVSQEMTFTADLHGKLASAIQQEAIKPIRQMLDEHTKRIKSSDSAVEKSSKLVTDNWSQQIKNKKKLMRSTKDHEAAFDLVENNKQIVSEKEKRKLLNKLKKSTELLTKIDQRYYELNRAGEDIRLKWESMFEQSYQVIQTLEKEKIKLLCDILNKYSDHITCFGRTLIERQRQIHEAVQNVNIEKDIQTLLDSTSMLSDENKIEFLLTDYYEEDNRNTMDKERRKTALAPKLQRLQDDINKVNKDKEGLEKIIRTGFRSPSFSGPPTEETVSMRDEATLKLILLELNFYKLASTVAELEGNPKPSHPLSDSIIKWKDKEYHHSLVQVSRPMKMKNVQAHRTNSVSSDGRQDHHSHSPQQIAEPIYINHTTNSIHSEMEVQRSEADASSADDVTDPTQEIGTCKALYDYQAGRDDELNVQQGDILIIHKKDASGWWFGSLRGKKGIFPATYVEELAHVGKNRSTDA
ncbi:nostrin isoform X2 [Scyliorhinus canicula]|uniref:nostrin isoform X2 n=1 Tax=Scyliorhinus canicula TaxID=7830 RepID=UPI0018F5FDD1|nr:nostrin isoform X2 [Scyliorhinus canicula]